MARPARAPSAAALMANCTSRETSPATYTPGILVPPFSSQFDALFAVAAPELLKQGRAGMPPGIEEERPPVEATAIDKTDERPASVCAFEPSYELFVHGDAARLQALEPIGSNSTWTMGAQHQIACPLMQEESQARALAPLSEHGSRRPRCSQPSQ